MTNTWTQLIMCSSPASRSVDLTLGPTPTVLVFSTWGQAQSSRILPGVSLEARWNLGITRVPPCEGTAYETPCGATLSGLGTFPLPGSWFELVDSTRRPTAAFLLVGTRHLRVPVASCFLYTDFPVVLPFSLTAPDRAQVYLPPVPFTGQVTMQGFTFGTGWLHGSNGLDVRCR